MKNKTLRVVIIEDEAPARDLIKAYLKDYPDILVEAECENGFEGVKAVNDLRPDLVFLDIQMPKLTGFEMLELLDEIPEIVFTTAYDQFALKAFEMNAVDYLMKPFSRERFRQALDKVYFRLQTKGNNPAPIEKLASDVKAASQTLSRIFVKTANRIDVIPVETITRIEAQDDYVEIFTPNGKFLKKETMTYLEEHLSPDLFVRVHRSHIVNVNNIRKIEKYGKESYVLILKDGAKVQVSKSRIKALKEQLGF